MIKREDTIMAIDPGINTGWALWDGDIIRDSGVIRRKKDKTLTEEKIYEDLYNKFYDVICNRIVQLTLIEDSQYRGDPTKAKSIIKLSKIIGIYMAVCFDYGRYPKLIHYSQWAGNMSAEMVKRRVKIATGKTYREHECDAVGMILAHQGLL